MDIQVLSNFLAVAREGNITRAAGLVHLTQSTLSRQMIALEKELGVQLLERQKYNVVLTEEGALFRRRAQEMVTLSDMAKEELSRASEELSGEIAIGCNETQSMAELAAFMKRPSGGRRSMAAGRRTEPLQKPPLSASGCSTACRAFTRWRRWKPQASTT